ncbi:MAG: Tad domain-containing protein [Anaerolineales bacterium]|nr:Tad domain-containing protein [Anaerolineales bacterium]
MMELKNKPERGQAIVLLVFAIVALLGFTALAVDGSMIYSDRRHAQNAADASSLAGGGVAGLSMENDHLFYQDFVCSHSSVTSAESTAITAATSRAGNNGYSTGVTITADCEDGSGSTSIFPDKYIEVTTEISLTTQTSFVHFVYDGPVNQEVAAVTRVRPRQPLAFGNAIVALNPGLNCGNSTLEGIKLSGGGETTIDGGGMWSNGCLKGTNNSCEVLIVDGSIQYAGGRFPASGDLCESMVPAATAASELLPEDSYIVPKPDCSHPNAVTVSTIDKNTTLTPNTLYCVTSSGNAIKIPNGTLTGHGVTIYLVNGGDVEISGGVINLSAPATIPDPWPAIPGILIYVNPTRDSIVKINGNSDSSYLGTIYAPRADVEVNGGSGIGSTFNTQIIGWNVEVSGNANININFNENWNYSRPSWLNLEE